MTEAFRPVVLVVEDDVIQRLSAVELLEAADMNVVQCESGEAAESILNRMGGRFRLLFTDMNLSGSMTGAQLAELAVERYPWMRIIVTSGRDPPRLPAAALFLAKPWNGDTVVREAKAASR